MRSFVIILFIMSLIMSLMMNNKQINSFRKKIITERFSQKDFNDRFMKFMLNLNLSFRFCENEFFLKFMRFMCNDIYISDRIKFSDMIKERINLIKRYVFNDFN